MSATTMATLAGSEKQVAWAESIRAGMLADVAKWVATYAKPAYPNYALRCHKAEVTERYLAAQTESRWFIDNRNLLAQHLINQLDDEGMFDGFAG